MKMATSAARGGNPQAGPLRAAGWAGLGAPGRGGTKEAGRRRGRLPLPVSPIDVPPAPPPPPRFQTAVRGRRRSAPCPPRSDRPGAAAPVRRPERGGRGATAGLIAQPQWDTGAGLAPVWSPGWAPPVRRRAKPAPPESSDAGGVISPLLRCIFCLPSVRRRHAPGQVTQMADRSVAGCPKFGAVVAEALKSCGRRVTKAGAVGVRPPGKETGLWLRIPGCQRQQAPLRVGKLPGPGSHFSP